MAFLSLKGVCKGYGAGAQRTDVLANIDLEVERGELIAIVGYSGAGKTTLISMIAGLTAPDAGTITLDARPVTGPGRDRGVVFQNYSLLPWMTTHENVLLAVDQRLPHASREERAAEADRFLAMVNLSAARGKRPRELSGGMRQRVSLARALALDPEVLLLDEPLGALDALTRATLQGELERLCAQHGKADGEANGEAAGKTVVLITNDVDEGILLADRIIPLSHGPRATLGPAVPVDIERPRDRKALQHDARWKRIRNQVLEYLLGPGSRAGREGARLTAEHGNEKGGENVVPLRPPIDRLVPRRGAA
jgi:nitrate/nitrite transport system ATP-binding protein